MSPGRAPRPLRRHEGGTDHRGRVGPVAARSGRAARRMPRGRRRRESRPAAPPGRTGSRNGPITKPVLAERRTSTAPGYSPPLLGVVVSSGSPVAVNGCHVPGAGPARRPEVSSCSSAPGLRAVTFVGSRCERYRSRSSSLRIRGRSTSSVGRDLGAYHGHDAGTARSPQPGTVLALNAQQQRTDSRRPARARR